MKTMIKRILLSVLIFSLTATTLSAYATSVDTAIFQADALGIFESENGEAADWSKPVTRAEFAHAMSVLLNSNTKGYSYQLPDVNSDMQYSGDIYAMIAMKLMCGDEDGAFRPNDTISFPEAAVVLLRALGYEPAIRDMEYPNSVMAYASRLGLLDNIDISASPARTDIAVMFHNAFDICIMSATFKGNGDISYYISDEKFGDTIFKADGEGTVYYGSGKVMQNAMAFVDVSYENLENNQVIIGDTLYDSGDTDAASFLGMEVLFCAKEKADGTYVITNITPTDKNDVKRFDAEDFEEYKHRSHISYWNGDKKTVINLDDDVHIIKNFDTITEPSDSIFKIDCGEYTVIDNDGDNRADVIIVYSYENAVVSGVDKSVITVKEGFLINGSRYLDFADTSKDILFKVENAEGKTMEVNDIAEGAAVSVATSRDGKTVKVISRNDSIVSDVLSESTDGHFIIDGKKYNVLYNGNYDVGSRYDFYLNFKDDIVYYKASADKSGDSYAYIAGVESGKLSGNRIKLIVSEQVDFGIETDDEDEDNITQIPMLSCRNREVKTVRMADKVCIDGTWVLDDNVRSRIDSGDRLYKFRLDADGNVKVLESAEFKAGSLYQTFTYNIYDKCFGMGAAHYEGFAIDEQTQIICIPNDPTCDEDYMVKNVINREGNTIGYNVRAYDYDETTKKCRLIVINRDMKSYNLPGVTVNSSKAAIVKNVGNVLDDGDIKVLVDFVLAGENKQMCLTDAAANAVTDLKEGDLFTYTEDYEDRITNVLKIRSAADLKSSFSGSSGLGSGASEVFGLLTDVAYDEVDELTTALAMEFSIDVNGSVRVVSVPQRNKPPIYLYNSNSGVCAGTMADIVPGTDKVYIFMKNATTVSAIVVIK